jgi:hypothetical protein
MSTYAENSTQKRSGQLIIQSKPLFFIFLVFQKPDINYASSGGSTGNMAKSDEDSAATKNIPSLNFLVRYISKQNNIISMGEKKYR